MLDVCAHDEDFAISLDANAVGSTGMIVPQGGYLGRLPPRYGEVFTGTVDLAKLKFRAHAVELNGEVLDLHLHREDFAQVLHGLIFTDRDYIDALLGIIERGEKGKALDVVPVEVAEGDDDDVLFKTLGLEVPAQISQTGACIDDGYPIGICKGEQQAGGISTKLLKMGIADRYRTAGAVEFEFHAIARVGA